MDSQTKCSSREEYPSPSSDEPTKSCYHIRSNEELRESHGPDFASRAVKICQKTHPFKHYMPQRLTAQVRKLIFNEINSRTCFHCSMTWSRKGAISSTIKVKGGKEDRKLQYR